MKRTLLTALLALSACAPEMPEAEAPVANATEPLFIGTGVTLFTANNNVVPFCWYTPGFAREKAIVQDAVRRTWAKWAPITFTWREGCPTTGSEQYVKIQIGEHTQVQDGEGNWYWDHSTDGQARGLGMASLSTPQQIPSGPFDGPGVTLWVEYAGTSEIRRLEYVAVHEVGHVLGFEHEQDRPEAEARACGPAGSGSTVGLYDRDSVMNYCNSRGNVSGVLSEGDITNIRVVYGVRAQRPDALADIDGDGDADPIAINTDQTWTLRSNGSAFVSPQSWSFPFYGTRETLFGDVNGDGRADAIAVNNAGVYVMTSNGSAFTNHALWLSSPFYGSRRTLVGDINGDGYADLVAVNNGGIWVSLSNGSSFGPSTQWSGQFFGTLATMIGDVNGDGRADLIANRGVNGLYVSLSSGNSFLPETWWYGAFFGEHVTGMSDVNGDGYADVVAVKETGIHVIVSSGYSFVYGNETTFPFFGSRDTLLGDVDGDGHGDVVAVNNTGLWVSKWYAPGYHHQFDGQWSGAFYSGP